MKCSSSGAIADDGGIYSLGSSGSAAATRQPRGSAIKRGETSEQTHNPYQYESAKDCYGEPLPYMPASRENRTVPWGSPGMGNTEGEERCCSSLEEVRKGIDAVDEQLLVLLAKR